MSPKECGPIEDFGLLVSTGRGLEWRCISSLREMLRDHDPDLVARPSAFRGLVKAWVGDPRGAIRHTVGILEDQPWHNEVVKRLVPIDVVVPPDPEDILGAASRLKEDFHPGDDESFRVRIRKRGAPIARMALIIQIAELFSNRVDLEHPDFELRVEMLRNEAGVSFIRRGEIFPDL